MGYKEEVAARLYEAFEEQRAAARRQRKSFGQKQLAEGVAKIVGGEPPSQSVVSRWMAKERPSLPENPVLDAAAEVLGVESQWLLFGKGPKHPRPTARDAIEGTTATLGRGEDARDYLRRKEREEEEARAAKGKTKGKRGA